MLDRRGKPHEMSPPAPVDRRLSGDFTPTLDETGTSLTLISRKGGANLRYAGLAAYDSTGKTLQARLVLQAEQVLIRVGDTKAKYPLVIDPFIEVAQLTSPEANAGDFFGYSVAISGNTLVIGAPQWGMSGATGPGAAYVFVEPVTGWATTSTFVAKLSASDGAFNDRFGNSVAISGNTIIAGAPNALGGGQSLLGATYLFVEPVTGWATMTETAKLTASAYDHFGQSVSISGPTLVVGATGLLTVSSNQPGAAYLFIRPSSGWASTSTFKAKLTASDGAFGDLFGWAVAINQDTVVVGAPKQNGSSVHPYGNAYVFVKPTTGWKSSTETGKLVPSDASTDFSAYGQSVAVSGNTIAVGAPNSSGGCGLRFSEAADRLEHGQREREINRVGPGIPGPWRVGCNRRKLGSCRCAYLDYRYVSYRRDLFVRSPSNRLDKHDADFQAD